jgi:hypothetical protein
MPKILYANLNGHLSHFHVLDTKKNAAMHIRMDMSSCNGDFTWYRGTCLKEILLGYIVVIILFFESILIFSIMAFIMHIPI